MLSELPGHITLAYEVPNGIAHRMQQWMIEYFKGCAYGADFGNAGILRTEPPAPVFISDIHMSTLQTRAPYRWVVMREREHDPLWANWVENPLVPSHHQAALAHSWMLDSHHKCSLYKVLQYYCEVRLSQLFGQTEWIDYKPEFRKHVHHSLHVEASETIE